MINTFQWKLDEELVTFTVNPQYGIENNLGEDFGIIEYIEPSSASRLKRRIEVDFNTKQRSLVIDVNEVSYLIDGDTKIAGTVTTKRRITSKAEYLLFRGLATGEASIGYIGNRAAINNQLENMKSVFGESIPVYKNIAGFQFANPIQADSSVVASTKVNEQKVDGDNNLLYLDALGAETTATTRQEQKKDELDNLLFYEVDGVTETIVETDNPVMITIDNDPSYLQIDGNSGSITLLVQNPVAGNTYEYSIDNGVSYQAEPLFSNLPSGVYSCLIRNIEQTASLGVDITSNPFDINVDLNELSE